MNRIVLIGNGFDLAHGLPTSYEHFINDYWRSFSENIFNKEFLQPYRDEFVNFCFRTDATSLTIPKEHKSSISSFEELQQRIDAYRKEFIRYSRDDRGMKLVFVNKFLEQVNTTLSGQKWVDVEDEYYKILKDIFQKPKKVLTPQALNLELKSVENELVKYLSRIQEEQIKPELKNAELSEKIFQPFDFKDISIKGNDAFFQFVIQRFKDSQDQDKRKHFLLRYGYVWYDFMGEIEEYLCLLKQLSEADVFQKIVQSKRAPSFFRLPDDILFLNFNYTKTASLYTEKTDFRINHIHGALNNLKNPVIFGYGDEMDEDYKKIENLNNNDYLKNIKSICYQNTDNYRNLLRFVNSAPYQILIMGHSCGNSDRTLLNTLFEHENCVSVKPYYYQKDEANDNYIEIVQNISRNFNNKALMRDLVVNKGYCEALPQNKPE